MTKKTVVRCGTKWMILVCSSIAGCASYAPIVVTEGMSAPRALLQPICGHRGYPFMPEGVHWDGRARLVWTAAHEVTALDCTLTYLHGSLDTITTWVDIDSKRAQGLREFLAKNHIPIAEHSPTAD